MSYEGLVDTGQTDVRRGHACSVQHFGNELVNFERILVGVRLSGRRRGVCREPRGARRREPPWRSRCGFGGK